MTEIQGYIEISNSYMFMPQIKKTKFGKKTITECNGFTYYTVYKKSIVWFFICLL